MGKKFDIESALKFLGKVEKAAKTIHAAAAAQQAAHRGEEIAEKAKEFVEDMKRSFEDAARDVAEVLAGGGDESAPEIPENTEEPDPTKEPAPEEPAAPAEPVSLDWCYGGFNGKRAKVADEAALSRVVLKDGVFHIQWEKGGCEQLGAKDKGDSDHTVCCAFLEDGKGGKFEWTSTSRATRDAKNIREGYNGWPKDALNRGGKLYFCICGVRDDKSCGDKRTAIVEVER